MRTIGNFLWFILVGLWSGMAWILVGILWCITIIGIPVGKQCFKISEMVLFPFKKDVIFEEHPSISIVANFFWIVFFGIELAAVHAIVGVFFCLTIIGIPFGTQLFKIAKISLMPFGAKIINIC